MCEEVSGMAKTHYRRCHQCGKICEQVIEEKAQMIRQCHHCHHFFPAMHFFDEEVALGLADPYETVFFRSLEKKTSSLPLPFYPPLCGLTVYWDDH